jgi:predicted Rossmann fold nucleotide-binding protein DprA/Smf involved in DNA uptake
MVASSARLAGGTDQALTARPSDRRRTGNGVGSRAHTRRPDRSTLPLTPLQAQTLAALTDEPSGPKAIADRTFLSPRQVRSGVLALSAKGLAVREAGGWRRAS